MKTLVRTSLFAGATVLPAMLATQQYRRLGMYTLLTGLSCMNHGGVSTVAYADRAMALSCIVDLWQRCSDRERQCLLMGISLYLLRHLTKRTTFHALAHLTFTGTVLHNAMIQRRGGGAPLPRVVVVFCAVGLGLLPNP